MKNYKFVSLFSGCGGMDLGFIQAGFTPIAAYDIWDVAVENYRNNIGSHAHIADLSLEKFSENIHCDIVLAGSPCQGFSTIGKRDIEDPRNNLIKKAVEIALKLEPKIIVLENVLGLLQGKHKKYWNYIIDKLENSGYRTITRIVDARDFGLPQSRKRVFVIASKGQKNLDVFNFSIKAKTLAECITDIADLPNHNPVQLSNESKDYIISSKILPGKKLCNVRGGIASVHTWDIPEVYGYVDEVEREILETIMKLRRRNRKRDFGDADPVDVKSIALEVSCDIERCLENLIDKKYLKKVGDFYDLANTFNGKYRRPDPNGVSYTVDTRFGDPKCFLHPVEHRGFSAREAARIQGFPDDYVFFGNVRDQFKMIGNAIPPVMAKGIAEKIKKII
ncbi:DNA cytosine methyltransferase [Vreelandella lutescens]|uniref:Cytosine-specific methyltransferase n=1 Tax=Vreelandella lutescens TaxID=1602943 RepID=A0ABQ1NGQ4_9GAMM|nr:DNA cytosine methyltransferase [Halomonas lutescens]GGC76696.1 cytosine-specific methyltransferase [Halomonas lutescens]